MTPITKKQSLKILKAAAYIAVSSALAGLATWATNNKDLFGVFYAPINILLVTGEQLFSGTN